MNEVSILNCVQATYRGFQSYADTGTVETVPPIGKTPTEFKTYFIQPNKVRFEWRAWHPYFGKEHPPEENVIWSNGERSHSFFLGKQNSPDGISLAIAGATGVSSGSVHMILKLLFPECIEISRVWYNMQNSRLLEDAEINGSQCYHLIGETKLPDDVEAWIGKDDMIVRRLRTHMRITPADREKMNAKAIEALTKAGVPPRHFPEQSLETREYYHEYNYQTVSHDGVLSAQLFSSK
jgi:hypothetical protein